MIFETFRRFPEIETDTLLLRRLMLTDIKPFFEIFADPETTRFIGRDPYTNISEARAKIIQAIDNYDRKEGIRWAITLKDSGKYIGSGGLWRIIYEQHRAEIGYEIATAYRGKGLMFEAASAMISYAFDVMELHSIEANTDPANTASNRLLEKLGFKLEGRTTESYYQRGTYTDTNIFSIVNK
jgi:ribosomal-protein-alanine N-acetyltransferase